MSLLIRNAEVVVTMDDQRRELRGGAILVRGNLIEAVGTDAEVAAWIAGLCVHRPTSAVATVSASWITSPTVAAVVPRR